MLACICFVCSPKTNELTKKYGPEFQKVYENHVKVQIVALETGDASILQETATGYELKHLTEIIEAGQAQEVLEWSKVEVEGLEVREYSSDTATISMYERYVGNIPDPSIRGRPCICQLQKKDGKWKVAHCGPPDFK
jgi:hypothetical protein